MILVCERLKQRLEKIWNKLQEKVLKEHPHISQIDCDEASVDLLEQMIGEYNLPTKFSLQVKNNCSHDAWQWLANDDELNHVDQKDAGVFTARELVNTIDYIVQYVDADVKFRIIPTK